MASSHAFSIGMLRPMTAASDPSARNQVASACAPTSSNSVESATPDHSLVLRRPSIDCGVFSGFGEGE